MIKLTNLKECMDCPICGKHGLMIKELEMNKESNSIVLECIACNYIISRKSPYLDLAARLSDEPLNYFKEEIESRNE